MKKVFKFSAQASRDAFLKDLAQDKYSVLSETEVEIVLADDMEEKEECGEKEEMCSKCELEHAMMCVSQELQYLYRYMNSEMSYVYQMFSSHMQGHLPPINSAEQMKTAISKLGLSEEYDVQKRVVYASTVDPKTGNVLVELTK